MDAALSDKEIEQMRQRFRDWLRWLLEVRAEEFASQRALAKAIGVSDATVSYYLHSERSPSLETALAVSRLSGHQIDYMLSHPPPPIARPSSRK